MTQAASVKKWFQPVSFPLWYRRLLSSLRELWRAESQVDVGFICADGSVVKAHAVMLANASKMMKSLLSSQIVTDVTESHDAVYYISLPDFSPDAVRVLMESLYLGSVPTNDNHHSEFRELCILFGIACQDEESMTDEEVEFEREPNSATTVASFDEDIQVLQTDDGELLLLSSRVDKNVITEKTNAEVGVATNAKEKVERPGGIEINQNKLCKLCHKKALEHRVFVVDNLQTTREPFFMYRCCMPSCKDKALKTSRAFHSHVEADHTSPQQDFLSAPDPQRTCPLCKKPRLQHKNRDLSGKANHDKKGSRYKCCHCSAARLSAAKFFAHVENHVEKKFKCVKCDKGFSYQHLLDAHKHKVHEQDGSGPKELFRCDQVRYNIITVSQYVKCMVFMAYVAFFLVQADCDYVTSYKQSLMGHKNERHLGLKRSHRQADMGQTVICLKCGKSLKKWYYQQYHKRSCMAGTSLYQCDICKQDGFVNKTTLKNHMRSKHSDERPYQCEYCPSKYATAMSLSCHRSRYGDFCASTFNRTFSSFAI